MIATGALRKVAKAGTVPFGSRRHMGATLAVLLLAGCPGTTAVPGAGLPDPTLAGGANRTASLPPVPKVKPTPPPAASVPSAALTAASLSASLPSPMVAALPQAVPAVPSAPSTLTVPSLSNSDTGFALEGLVGLDEVQTLHLLGSPVAREEAPPAKVWRYAKGDCTLKVFFFMDMTSSQDFRALSYDMKSSQNVPDADHRCFAQLLTQAGSAGY